MAKGAAVCPPLSNGGDLLVPHDGRSGVFSAVLVVAGDAALRKSLCRGGGEEEEGEEEGEDGGD